MTEAPKLSANKRYRLIAAIVTEFVTPMNAEQVRQNLRVELREPSGTGPTLRVRKGVNRKLTLLEAVGLLPIVSATKRIPR